MIVYYRVTLQLFVASGSKNPLVWILADLTLKSFKVCIIKTPLFVASGSKDTLVWALADLALKSLRFEQLRRHLCINNIFFQFLKIPYHCPLPCRILVLYRYSQNLLRRTSHKTDTSLRRTLLRVPAERRCVSHIKTSIRRTIIRRTPL